MTLWSLAWRNVLRNRRRSVITVSSISVGLAALTFLWGFIDGGNRQMIENTTRYLAGDVQIHLKGYHDDPTFDLTMDEAEPLLGIVRENPAVAAASLRMEGKALASQGDKSRGVMLVGIAPSVESNVTNLFEAVIAGQALSDERNSVLVGEKLAEALSLQVGHELVLVGQGYDGSIASTRVPVGGIFRTKIDELDGFIAVMPLPAVREFFAAPDGATAMALRLRDRGQRESVEAQLSARLGPRYEIVGWPRLLPLVAVSTRYHEVTGFIVLAIFFVVVAAGVANPVLMAVLERTREFGIMLGIGTSPARLLRLVLYEAVLLGLLGLVIGNALGLAITGYYGYAGIDLSAFEAGLRTMPGLADVIYPAVRLERSVAISAVVFATACLVALYPAAKAARLDPVDAIRGVLGRNPLLTRGHATHGRGPVFLLIAGRSILRNSRRTAITVGGTAFAIAAYVFLFGYYDGFGEQIIRTATSYSTGHIQIESDGFRKDFAPQLALADASSVLAMVRTMAEIQGAAPRVQAQALASSAAKSEGIALIGIDPVAERNVTFIHQTMVEGQPLEAGVDREIVIGRKLAEKLSVRLGERIVVMAQDRGGDLATSAYRIRGIFATESSAYDSAMAFVTLPAAQALLGLGERVSTINIRLRDRSSLERTAEELRSRLDAPGRNVATWPELLPQIDEMVKMLRVFRAIVLATIFAVVALAVMNTVFMAVAERTREFGVMMALGTSPVAVVRLVLYETIILMLLASVLGYSIGVMLVAYFGERGIDLSRFFANYTTIPGLTGISYPVLVIANIVVPGVALFLASVVVALYPAMRAARLAPASAIRHV
jgi:putative ABC transport system permease protein